MVHQYARLASTTDLLGWVHLAPSSYYYHPKAGRRGRKPSTHTWKKDGTCVSNEQVVADIKQGLTREFCCYGYHNMTSDLRDMHYIINPKKVYRLMDESNLLLGKVIRCQGKRSFVQHRRIQATRPMQYLCLDIKYVWVAGEKRNYYLLTVLDVFTRYAVEQIFQSSIRKTDVIRIFRRINLRFGIKGVTIRNDNGSQFIANDVKQFLRSEEAIQEFTHVATPEENAYIEAFHSIVQREVIDRFDFESYYEAKGTLQRHRHWYNTERKHGELGRITPHHKWIRYQNTTFEKSGEAEASAAGEQLARNSLMNGDNPTGADNHAAPLSPTSSLFQMPPKTQSAKEETDLNSFADFLQEIGG